MKKLIILSSITAGLLFANGYKIPEQSINGMALSAAYVANAKEADSAYYNPANMIFNEDKHSYELLITYIYLPKITFKNDNGESYDSRKEEFLVPQFHFSSKNFNGWRFGVSIITPAGLSKRWDDIIPQAGAKEFTLKTIELNPTIAKQINNNFSVGFGIRAVKSEGTANILGIKDNGDGTTTPLYSQYLNGTSVDFGWNAAISYQNDNRDLKIAATYRSKVNLTLKGDVSGYYLTNLLLAQQPTLPLTTNTYKNFNTSGRVAIPIPAALNLAVAKTFDKTTVEIVIERTFWSSYKKLDFDFDDPFVDALFGTAKPKEWKDVNTYRIGITHKCTDKLTAMVGYAYDKTPVPDSTLDFSLPDSNKHIFSGGIKYKYDDRLTLGFSALYTKQTNRRASIKDPVSGTYTNGEFTKGRAFLIAFGIDYAY